MKRLLVTGAFALLIAVVIAATATGARHLIVTSSDIRNGTIRSVDIRNGTIALADLSPAARAALRGQTGARGPAGAPGPTGPAGPAGPRGGFDPAKITYIEGAVVVVPPDDPATPEFEGLGDATATCPTGTTVISGGFFAFPAIVALDTNIDDRTWIVTAVNDTTEPSDLQAFATCAAP